MTSGVDGVGKQSATMTVGLELGETFVQESVLVVVRESAAEPAGG
jgi:hypothetical protein